MTDNRTTDTREKLEADIAETIDFWGAAYPDARVRTVLRWLDRQAAITERYWMEIVGASANANVELKRQIDELQAKLDERENELGIALNEVAEKWAIEQIEAKIVRKDARCWKSWYGTCGAKCSHALITWHRRA